MTFNVLTLSVASVGVLISLSNPSPFSCPAETLHTYVYNIILLVHVYYIMCVVPVCALFKWSKPLLNVYTHSSMTLCSTVTLSQSIPDYLYNVQCIGECSSILSM